MSSDDESHEVPQFESAGAGASTTYPMQANNIRKGNYVCIKNRPCKVVDVSTSKTGKHGHAKCHFVAIDIFNRKKYEDLTPSSHNMDVPFVSKTDYTLLNVDEDGAVSLMDANGNNRDDLGLPIGDEEDQRVADGMKAAFDEGKEVIVTVLKAMGEEKIETFRVGTA